MECAGRIPETERQQTDQAVHRLATQERDKIQRTTQQRAVGGLSNEGGNHLEQDSTGQTTVEGSDGGLHPAVDRRQWRVLMEGYTLQWTDDSGGF